MVQRAERAEVELSERRAQEEADKAVALQQTAAAVEAATEATRLKVQQAKSNEEVAELRESAALSLFGKASHL